MVMRELIYRVHNVWQNIFLSFSYCVTRIMDYIESFSKRHSMRSKVCKMLNDKQLFSVVFMSGMCVNNVVRLEVVLRSSICGHIVVLAVVKFRALTG